MKTIHRIHFSLAGGNRQAGIYEGTSAGKAKEYFHLMVPVLRASETKGRLSWTEGTKGNRSMETAYVQFDNGQIVDTAGAVSDGLYQRCPECNGFFTCKVGERCKRK